MKSKSFSQFLVVALIAAGVLAAAIVTRGEAGSPQITKIDNKLPNTQGTIIDPISQTPSFEGTAPAGSLVSIFRQAAITGADELTKVAGEQDLSISNGGPAVPFTDDFSGNYQDQWYLTLQGGSQANGAILLPVEPGVFTTTDGLYAADAYQIPSSGWNIETDFSLPSDYTPSTASGPDPFAIRFGVNGTDGANMATGDLALNWSVGGTLALISSMTQLPSSTSNLAMVPGTTYRLKLSYANGTLEASVDGQVIASANGVQLPNNLARISPFVAALGADSVTATIDNFASNLIPDSTVSVNRMGMSYNGTPYMDPSPFFQDPSAPGVILWSNDADATQLPAGNIAAFPFTTDVYVYLSTLTIPAGAMGGNPEIKLRWTNYASTPENFAQIVYFINTQVGFPFVVDAYAKAASQENGVITPVTTPLANIGRIGTGGQLLPPMGNLQLIARAQAGIGGSWSALFGKDENGQDIPELVGLNLAAIGESPYTFVVHADTGTEVLESTLAVIATTVGTTSDTTAPISSASVTGTAQPAPFQGFYADQATVTLAATDNDGGSGVQKIEYSLSGAVNRPLGEYTAPIVINVAGETTVTYMATDNAGNGEISQTVVIRIDKDTDGDTIYDNFDGCVLTSGSAQLSGCANAIRIKGRLRVHYDGKTAGYAAIENGKQKREARLPLKVGAIGDSRNESVESLQAKVYKKSTLATAFGRNVDRALKQQCDMIFNQAPAITTKSIVTGDEYIGVSGKEDYVLAVRTTITEPGSSQQIVSTVCRKVDASSFRWNPTGTDGADLVRAKGNTGTVARPRVKFTKTVKAPRAICTADDDQDSPDPGEPDDDRD